MRINLSDLQAAREQRPENAIALSEGWYEGKVLSAEEGNSRSGTPGLMYTLRIKTGREDRPTTTLKGGFYYRTRAGAPNGVGLDRVDSLISAMGAQPDKKGFFDVEDLEGPVKVRLRLEPEEKYTGDDGKERIRRAKNEPVEFASMDSNVPLEADDTERMETVPTAATATGAVEHDPDDIPF